MKKNKRYRNNRYRKYRYLRYLLMLVINLFVVGGLFSSFQNFEKKEYRKEKELQKNPEAQMEISNPNIRVLIMTDGYAEVAHPTVEISAVNGLVITYGEETEETEGMQSVIFAPDDPRFQSGNVRIYARDGGEITLQSIERGCGTPSYAGILELRTTAEGVIVINELPVETYLCKVVPSEMPASYELEALKAQAVCARSYAYQQMQDYAYPEYEAHVNDSTDYQVYGNSLPQNTTNQAVEETKGQVVRYQGQIVTTYYYSTSCGKTTNLEAWGTECNEQNAYLQSVEVKDSEGDYEQGLPWYRWEADIPVETLSNLIGINTGKDIGVLQSLEVTKEGPGGVALQICAVGEKGQLTVETENKIRRALGGSGYEIRKQDGTNVASSSLLPSAFFTIQREGDIFFIKGGGYGHGIGMSQNGANEMAKKGKNYIDILTLFFQGITVE